MDENSKTFEDNPSENSPDRDNGISGLVEVSESDLKRILAAHKKWLETGGDEGQRAELRRANLAYVDLQGARLQHADLEKANLKSANLKGANLKKCNLRRAICSKASLAHANLKGAYLRRANLQHADLSYADLRRARLNRSNLKHAYLRDATLHEASLTCADLRCADMYKVRGLAEAKLLYANLDGVTGLLGDEFYHADVTGVTLPREIREFKSLEQVEEISKNARKIFFAMILGCVYSWLTVATTTDVRLLTNTSSSPLPIIGTEIPIVWFYIVAPAVLLGLYIYFHFYLDNLWKGLAGLPAVFPDGKYLDERAYPWLLNCIICRYCDRLKDRPPMSHIKEQITIALAWWAVPVTLIGFWLRYLPRHDWKGTMMHIALIAVSLAASFVFYNVCSKTIRGAIGQSFLLKASLKQRSFYYAAIVVLAGFLFFTVSFGAIKGVNDIETDSELSDPRKVAVHTNLSDIKILVPLVLKYINSSPFANFANKEVSSKPENYWEIVASDRTDSIRGANLKSSELQHANIIDAFLSKANLREAKLQSANLSLANLENADLTKANLKDAVLNKTNLKKANLEDAILENAYLWEADFRHAALSRAVLKNAQFQSADLESARFYESKLMEANLINANLQNAKLVYANLQKANLSQANLKDADLTCANLCQAYLVGARNLTVEQLSKVQTLYEANLDPEKQKEIENKYPELLEEPINITHENIKAISENNEPAMIVCERVPKIKLSWEGI